MRPSVVRLFVRSSVYPFRQIFLYTISHEFLEQFSLASILINLLVSGGQKSRSQQVVAVKSCEHHICWTTWAISMKQEITTSPYRWPDQIGGQRLRSQQVVEVGRHPRWRWGVKVHFLVIVLIYSHFNSYPCYKQAEVMFYLRLFVSRITEIVTGRFLWNVGNK